MSHMVQYMAGFEILAQSLHAHRCVAAGELDGLSDLDWPGRRLVDRKTDIIAYPTAQTLFQLLLTRFLDEGWHVICLPPGLPYANCPGAGAIAVHGELGEAAVAGHWMTFLMDRDGRRPGRSSLRVAPGATAERLRTCAAARAQISNSLTLNHTTRFSYLSDITKIEEICTASNVSLLREFALKSDPQAESDIYARMLFGGVWDLLSLLFAERSESVAQGAWRFPDAAPRLLRAKVAIVEIAACSFFLPAALSPELLRLRVLDWLLISKASTVRSDMLMILDMLTLTHKLWLETATSALTERLSAEGILPSARARRVFALALSSDRNVRVPGRIMSKATEYLDARGHMDWSFRLRRHAHPSKIQWLRQTMPMQRLRERLHKIRSLLENRLGGEAVTSLPGKSHE